MPKVLARQPSLSPSARLRLTWLASPALPVGGFSYSEGLEAAVEAGLVTTELQASQWLRDQLHLSLARADLAVVAHALAAWQRRDAARLAELNDWVTHTRESAEFRLQAEQMGRSLVEWLRNAIAGTPDASSEGHAAQVALAAALRPTPTWPVVFALAAAQALPPGPPSSEAVTEVLLSFAFGWAENMVQAAIKAVPLGQSAGQRILQALADDIPDAIEHARRLPDGQRQAFTPMLAILSSRHETQYSRLFRS